MKLEEAQTLPVAVEWDTWCGVARATLTHIGAQGIHLRCSDGYEEYRPTSWVFDVPALLARMRRVAP